MYKKISLISLILALFILLGNFAQAQTAEIFFAPASAVAKPGELLQVSVFLQTESTLPVNALEANIIVPENVEIESIKTTDSVINFWIEAPSFDKITNTIRFSGIIPGGFAGVLSPLKSERQPGKLFDLILSGSSLEKSSLEWQNPQALLNKPDAMAVELVAKNLTLTFDTESINSAPVLTLAPDTDPPERFQPEVARDENILDGQWFVAFATRDTGVGVKVYQVAEYLEKSDEPNWQEAVSPYVLRDQTRASYVSVRAIDLAGNTRTETVVPETSTTKPYPNYQFWLIIIVLCIAALCYHYFYSVYSRRR